MRRRIATILMVATALMLNTAVADAQWGNSHWGTLWAGQFTDSGTYALRVTADCSELMVEFIPENDWEIAGYHVDIVSDDINFPTNNPGNPKVGHFQWSASFPPTSINKSFYVLPDEVIDPITCGNTIFVAIHAQMVQRDASGNIIREATAWGGPPGWGDHAWDPYTDLPDGFSEFPGNRWGFNLSFLWEGAPTPTPTPTPLPPTPTFTPILPTPTFTPIPPTPTFTPILPTPTFTPIPPTPTDTPIPPTPTDTPIPPTPTPLPPTPTDTPIPPTPTDTPIPPTPTDTPTPP
jgi:hypothetical protein